MVNLAATPTGSSPRTCGPGQRPHGCLPRTCALPDISSTSPVTINICTAFIICTVYVCVTHFVYYFVFYILLFICHILLTLFSPLGKPADRAIYFTCRKLSNAIPGSTGPIFTILSPNGRYLWECCQTGPFFQFLKGRCHGNQFCVVADLFAGSQSISGSARPIFTIFAPYGRY